MKSAFSFVSVLLVFSAAAQASDACLDAANQVRLGEKAVLNLRYPDNRVLVERIEEDYTHRYGVTDEKTVELEWAAASYIGSNLVGYAFVVSDYAKNPPVLYTFDSDRRLLEITPQTEKTRSELVCEGYTE
jgi:hypothetical protein